MSRKPAAPPQRQLTGPLPPGSRIGVLGGGQLGRMLALAAARLGLTTHIYSDIGHAPAAFVAARTDEGTFNDIAALRAFAAHVDVVTYEFENVPVAALDALADLVPVYPPRRALEVAQDRLLEKQFLAGLGFATAPFAAVDSADPAVLGKAALATDLPAILKTRRFGYDGKGQHRVGDLPALAAAATALNGAPAILEGVVPLVAELSVIAVRGLDGTVACYDCPANVHRDGILDTSTVPSGLPSGLELKARAIAERIVTELSYVGVIGVEMFVTTDGGLLVNEIAPRVHNSGHWTLDACTVSQFENHMRAVAGWPLGSTARHSDAVMTNLIGSDAANWRTLAATPGTAVHLYGKGEARPGRKMGHITRLTPG